MYRTLGNGEKLKQSWLICSRKDFRVMTNELSNWMNIGIHLKSHESSPEHMHNMATWKELELLLKTGKTIDQAETSLLEAERKYR